MNALNKIKGDIISVVNSHPHIVFCTVYGSFATDRVRETSDLDIAVAGKDPLSKRQKIAIVEELSLVVKREVDLIDLQQVSGTILQEALCKGSVMVNNDNLVYAFLLRKMWYNQADMMPYYRRILETRRKEFLYGK